MRNERKSCFSVILVSPDEAWYVSEEAGGTSEVILQSRARAEAIVAVIERGRLPLLADFHTVRKCVERVPRGTHGT